MGFSDAVRSCLAQYAGFSGRARRSEYWYFILFEVAVVIGAVLIGLTLSTIQGGFSISTMTLALGLPWLALMLPSLAVSVRRFHDLGQTGWLVLAFAIGGLIPIIGYAVSIGNLIWFCFRGTTGTNRYGPDPYGQDGPYYDQIFA